MVRGRLFGGELKAMLSRFTSLQNRDLYQICNKFGTFVNIFWLQHFIRNIGEWLSGQFVGWMQSRGDFFQTLPEFLQPGDKVAEKLMFSPQFNNIQFVSSHLEQIFFQLRGSLSRLEMWFAVWFPFQRPGGRTRCLR